MTLPNVVPSLLRWFNTLKFKIVVMAVVTGVLSAVGTTQLVLTTTQADLERLLLRNDASDSELTAALLASKLEMLQIALGAVARQAGPELWLDRARMTRFLLDKPATNALFDVVYAARADGEMLVRLERGRIGAPSPNIADREYFQRALKTDQPVVSNPLIGRVTKVPGVLIVIPVLARDGTVTGVIAGSLTLHSTSLF